MDERIKLYEDLANAMANITNERSSKESLTRIQDLCGKLKHNKTQGDKLKKEKDRERAKNPPKVPQESVRKRQAKAQADLTAAMEHVKKEFRRLKSLQPPAEGVCNEVQQVLNNDGIFP